MTNFLGHTRFSLLEPNSPSWRLSREVGKSNREEYATKLFSESRLASRSHIFLNYTLPIIDMAASHHNIIHIVSYPSELPTKYKRMLLDASERFTWLYLDECTSAKNRGRYLDRIAKEHFAVDSIYSEYRLDDDDVLSSTFFDQLSPYVRDVHVGSMVSLGLGVQSFYDKGTFLKPRLEHRPKIAIGLARICRVDANEITGPTRVSHTRSDRVCTVVLDSRSVAYIHTLHLNQDSGIQKPNGDLARRIRNYLRLPLVPDDFDLDKLFPGVPFDESGNLPSETRPTTFLSRLTMAVESVYWSYRQIKGSTSLRKRLRALVS